MTPRCLIIWALVGALGFAACETSKQGPTDGAPTTEAVPPDGLRTCAVAGDCVQVGISCNACCQEAAVNVNALEAYGNYRTDVCAAYSGPVCDCVVQPSRVVCRQQRCALEAVQTVDGG
jgi:hypothetical protein